MQAINHNLKKGVNLMICENMLFFLLYIYIPDNAFMLLLN